MIKTLRNINWDFLDSQTNGFTHSIHPYPAKFIPQIPHNLILALSQKGATVYDPFVGCGTTCVEANILGRNAIANDVNELSVLITKVKTSPIKESELKILDSILNKIYNRIHKLYNSSYDSKVKKPNIINIDKWFYEFVIYELTIIKEELLKIEQKKIADLGLITLSSIIVNVSLQDSDTRYVRTQKALKPLSVYLKFKSRLQKNIRIILSSSDSINNGRTKVKFADTRSKGIFKENCADLAITSPPYPNAYDYHLYHKYRMYWLDMDPKVLRKKEIGSHSDYSKKNGLTENDFKNDMLACFSNIAKILKPNCYFVIVIGDSILKGRKIKNNELLKDVSTSTTFKFIEEYDRNIRLSKKSFNPIIGNIKTERIMIFRNKK